MATVIPAEGLILERILEATYPMWHQGLSRQAYVKFDAAQRHFLIRNERRSGWRSRARH